MGSGDTSATAQQRQEQRQKMHRQQEKQARANTPVWLALLFVVAVTSFLVLGGLVARREAHATAWADLRTTESAGEVVTPGSPTTTPTGQGDPLAVLARGIVRSATMAAQALSQEDATAGAVAMDAAMRAAEVGRDGSPDAARAPFDSALRLVRQARTQRQNGDPARAAMILDQVGRVFTAFRSTTATLPSDLGGYDGARLLNGAGTTIGVVDHVVRASSGQPDAAMLVVGGYHHVLGFLDFGGTRLTVPAERLVFGNARALGPTRVVLATLAETSAELRRELAMAGTTKAR